MVYLFLKVKESNNTNYPINIQYFYILYIYLKIYNVRRNTGYYEIKKKIKCNSRFLYKQM